MSPISKPTTLNTADAADYLGVSKRTLEKWRLQADKGPTFVRVGNSIRYHVKDLDAFMNYGTVRRVG